MSNESAAKKMSGHGRVICKKCKKVIISCRCFKCSEIIKYDTCDECEKKDDK